MDLGFEEMDLLRPSLMDSKGLRSVRLVSTRLGIKGLGLVMLGIVGMV